MKKIFGLMLLCAIIVTVTSCDNDDELSNSLQGTIWTASYVDELFVIEFESVNKVSGYRADSNGHIKGDVYYGTYTTNGDNITFNNFYIVNFYKFYFTDGTITGNNMKLNYWWEMGRPGNKERFYDTKTFHRK
jgi:hypothetical protein